MKTPGRNRIKPTTPIVTIGDLLDRIDKLEKRVEGFYAAVSERCRDNDVRLLTYYLSRRRRHLSTALSGFTPRAIREIRGGKVGYNVAVHPATWFDLLDSRPSEVQGGQLLKCTIRYCRNLKTTYKNVLLERPGENGILLLKNLIRMEVAEEAKLKEMLAMNYF